MFLFPKKICWSTFSLLNTDSRAKLEHTLFMVYGLSFIHIFTFQNYVFNSILKMVSNGKLVENRFWLMIVIIVEVSILWIFSSYCKYLYIFWISMSSLGDLISLPEGKTCGSNNSAHLKCIKINGKHFKWLCTSSHSRATKGAFSYPI